MPSGFQVSDRGLRNLFWAKTKEIQPIHTPLEITELYEQEESLSTAFDTSNQTLVLARMAVLADRRGLGAACQSLLLQLSLSRRLAAVQWERTIPY